MSTETAVLNLNPTRLLLAAVIGLIIMLVLIIKFKIQAMISILVGAISIGLISADKLKCIKLTDQTIRRGS